MGLKRHFKREFQVSSFNLDHETVSDFYVSCFQRNRATLPLLFIRCVLFLGCIGIVLSSMILTSRSMSFGLWWIYLTHWGLLFITAATGLAFATSARAYLRGPIDATFGLPWYVKAYWVGFNIALPNAFFITLFYWILLTGTDEEYAINLALDVFIHGINSVVMLVLLATSRHPMRILHCYFPILAGIIYLLFSAIFHLAGGLAPHGTSAIYPMLDWSQPGTAMITTAGSAIIIILMHLFAVGLTKARDALTKDCRDSSGSLSITNQGYNY